MMPMSDKNAPSNSLALDMRCGILTNVKGETLIVHDKELKEPVQWIEYNKVKNQMLLVYESGVMQDLGINIDKEMRNNLLHGIKVVVAHLKDKKIQSSQTVVLLIQKY